MAEETNRVDSWITMCCCKCISGPVNLFYMTSRTYDPEDEGRISHDDPEIDYDWLEGPRSSDCFYPVRSGFC